MENYKISSGIFTYRLLCAKINYFMRQPCVYCDTYNLIINDTGIIQSLKKIDLEMLQKIILYVWNNIIVFDYLQRHIFLNFSINGHEYNFSATCDTKYYIIFLLGKNVMNTIVSNYINNIFNKYDEIILFRIWFLINLVDDNLMNKDIMHVILDKVFFDQIKN